MRKSEYILSVRWWFYITIAGWIITLPATAQDAAALLEQGRKCLVGGQPVARREAGAEEENHRAPVGFALRRCGRDGVRSVPAASQHRRAGEREREPVT